MAKQEEIDIGEEKKELTTEERLVRLENAVVSLIDEIKIVRKEINAHAHLGNSVVYKR